MKNKTITEQTEIEQQYLDEEQLKNVVGGVNPVSAVRTSVKPVTAATRWLDDVFSKSAKNAGNNVKFQKWRYEKGLAK